MQEKAIDETPASSDRRGPTNDAIKHDLREHVVTTACGDETDEYSIYAYNSGIRTRLVAQDTTTCQLVAV